MQEESSHPAQKRFEIFEQWHRTKPGVKVYRIRLYLLSNMVKVEEKLKMKYGFPQDKTPSSGSLSSRKGPNEPNDDLPSFDNMMADEDSKQDFINSSNTRISTSIPPTPSITPFSNPQIQEKEQKIDIFQNFSNRGKFDTLKFHFNRQKQYITLIISQDYFLNELKRKQFDLLMIHKSFYRVWQQDYFQMLQGFIKYSKDFKVHEVIKLQFVAIDIIGVTFDVMLYSVKQIAYNNKIRETFVQQKRFRFRYSPFQFRQNPIFEEKNIDQIMSFVEIHSGNINTVSHQDFYSTMRVGFVDDINNNNDLWKRMINRFWVFYQLHGLNRGMSEYQEFNKKALGRVHFHSTRMKKFQLIFPFPLLNRAIIEERKQSTLYITFYLEQKDIYLNENGIEFKMTVNLVQHHGIVTFEQKKELIARLRKEELFIIIEKSSLESNELFQFYMTMKFDDKIGRAFAKIQTIVSHFLDKVAFSDLKGGLRNSPDDNDQQKTLQILSKQWIFKENQYVHTHQLCLEVKHKFLTPIIGLNNLTKYIDDVQYFKLSKKKKKWNEKSKKDEGVDFCEISLHDDLKRYITQILRSKPLRQCYRQIMQFLQNVSKVIFKPFDDNKIPQKLQNREILLGTIIGNLMKLVEMGNNHTRRSQIYIYTLENQLMMRQEEETDIICEVSFSIKDLKICWIKRLPQGYIIVRMGENFVEVVKDLAWSKRIQVDWQNIQATSAQMLKQLKNILLKQYATLQNMMI